MITHYLLGAPLRSQLAGNEANQSSITTGAGGVKGDTEWTVSGGSCHYFSREALLLPKSLQRNRGNSELHRISSITAVQHETKLVITCAVVLSHVELMIELIQKCIELGEDCI